jgi:glycosyltransferase involved in cell wall biosynthesis
MLLLEYANYDSSRLAENFGAPEYSYLFVKNAFRHVLERIGRPMEVKDPAREVDAIYRAAQARGEPCVYLPFCPPNTAPVGFACPTVPVFAWEYERIPDEVWNNDAREDWTWVLGQTAGAITHCQSAGEAVRRAMGERYPLSVIPAPLFETFARAGTPARGWREPFELVVEGGLAVSANDIDLTPFRPDQPTSGAMRMLRLLERAAVAPGRPVQTLRVEGVVYTAVFNPYDGRKNWLDLVAGFIGAFRETPTATLLVKLTRYDLEDGLYRVLQHLSQLGPFACKVVLIQGLLSDPAYRALIDATSYAVNTAFGEGQCLPLMEYMAAGRPAVAPMHSAMLDYISPQNAFVIASQLRQMWWPHDERRAMRCHHYYVSFADYMRQLGESYRVARDDAAAYARMSKAAVKAMRAFCSDDVAEKRLREFLEPLAKSPPGQEPRTARSAV